MFADLARQLAYSPAEKRTEQLAGAIALSEQLEPARTYPWEFVLFRITGFRPLQPVDHALPGRVLQSDLSKLIEALSDSLNQRADQSPTPVLALEHVTQRFRVAAKTIQRWRRKGLIAQRYIFPDGRRRLGFLEPAIQRFAGEHAEHVAHAARFRQLSEREKAIIITHGRRLASKCQCCLLDISRRLGRKLKRAPETIRYIIRQYDRTHPDTALFPDTGAPIRTMDRAIILDCFDRGVPVECLAKRYCRTRSSIYRVVTQQRAEKLQAVPIEFMPNPLFELPDADTILLQDLPREAQAKAQQVVRAEAGEALETGAPRGLPAYLADIFRQPVMVPELEIDAFRRMNYLKFKARKLQQALDPAQATSTELAEIEALLNQATRIKNELVQANLRVGVHVARKHQRPGADLMELVSDATIWILRAVEKFDFARGVKFSTYASFAIMKNFARVRVEQIARRDNRLTTGQDETLNQVAGRETASITDQLDSAAAQSELAAAIRQLAPREQLLLRAHWGLDPAQPAVSLAELGAKLGITKARVRQLETRAMRKLRRLMEERRGTPAPAEP